MADAHSDGTDDQEGLPSKVVEEEDGGEGEHDLEASSHTSR